MSTTWFRVRGSPKVIHTTSGASPGGPLADLCFQVGFSFFLDRLHQDLRNLGAAACLLNDGDAECEMPIPTWVDDIALLITHPCPEQLAELVPVVADRCRRRLQNIGIQMNMKQGKSECMFCLYGRNSRAVRRKVLIDQGCEILVSGEPDQTLRVTDRYVHLGTLLKWDGDMTPELRKRNAIAHESFRQLCKDVFRNPALPLKTKKQVFVLKFCDLSCIMLPLGFSVGPVRLLVIAHALCPSTTAFFAPCSGDIRKTRRMTRCATSCFFSVRITSFMWKEPDITAASCDVVPGPCGPFYGKSNLG